MRLKIFTCLAFLLLPLTQSISQDSLSANSLIRVNIDCNTHCDFEYLRTEINYVDFVPDRFLANVFVQITSQRTGSGGSEVKLFFNGQKNFNGKNDTLQFNRSSVDTDDEFRATLARYLKLGLTPYIAKTPLASTMNISVNRGSSTQPVNSMSNKKDPWNSWVFNIGARGSLNNDDYSKSSRYGLEFSANRVTEKMKIRSGIEYSKNRREIEIDNFKSEFINDNLDVDFNPTFSLTDHWSYGFRSRFSHSSFSNYDKQYVFQPAIEYSLFPYKESVKKAITVYYQLGYAGNEYIDTSYYSKLKDHTWEHSLSINANFIQKWGSVSAWASWNSFLNSFELVGEKVKGIDINSFSIGGFIEFRVVKGLSVHLNCFSDFTQGIFPNIRKADFNSEDILANVRQYPTTNSIHTSVGINYRFGSIYNNVVNPRFNKGGGRFFFFF